MTHAAAPVQSDDLESENVSILFKGDYQRIFRYIVTMVRDAAEAEDLTQETFLRAVGHRETLRDQGAQMAWLYRIATHVCLDRLRQFAREAGRTCEADPDEADLPEPDAPSLQKISEREEMSTCVQGYLNRLSDPYRAVILLHDMHEARASEIAGLLGISLAAVKMRLHRARQSLRRALQAGCEFSYEDSDTLTCESRP
jgi:RNA polymerase sigma-70 factor (ECF subfamily)